MGSRTFAMTAAAAAAFVAASANAQEIERPATTTFFVAIPLDARNAKEATLNFGLQFQGSRPYQYVKVDYQTLHALPAALAAVEAKYLFVGAVAVGAAVAVSKKDKQKSESFQQQQAQQQAACPEVCAK